MPLANTTPAEWAESFAKRIAHHKNQYAIAAALAEDLIDNPLCKNVATRGSVSVFDSGVWDRNIRLYLYDYDLPTVIEHVAGPFHRKHNVDWKLNIPWEGRIELRTCLVIDRDDYQILIVVSEGIMATCVIEQVITRTKTPEEIAETLKAAADPYEYEYKIACAEAA